MPILVNRAAPRSKKGMEKERQRLKETEIGFHGSKELITKGSMRH
jgi:hypothetical protein